MIRAKFLRINNGFSQTQVARRVGLPQSLVSMLEAGRYLPTDQERTALGRVLGSDPDRLLDHISAADLPDGAESRDGQRNRRESGR